MFLQSQEEVSDALSQVGYLPSTEIATTVFLATKLSKPILVEGPAGTGKTELAKALARAFSLELIRLQCYEGLDESRALYEWDYRKQLLALQAHAEQEVQSIFSSEFLLERPLLAALRGTTEKILLIDEVDRLEIETEALLLEVLAEFQVTVPELGTVTATSKPIVILTSNGMRELSEALKRRALYLYLDYPSQARERDIVCAAIPEIEEELADRLVSVVARLRSLDLKKSPSISETLDWARSLLALSVQALDDEVMASTLPILLKNRADIERAAKELLTRS
ncbi:replication factor C large subunit [Ferrimicrobium acidiphilum DSM 19497]|uniref:Replication factor C large subunit n=1 Tax=Ferrimicrobium acidiphilum DSM 19497 TaxID=1121877 RepID=A0A0D8FXW2_9ACTN|nr:replication factor C large subunit [Ferrimicrobium acidiphilum DSM 19497]